MNTTAPFFIYLFCRLDFESLNNTILNINVYALQNYSFSSTHKINEIKLTNYNLFRKQSFN